MIQAEADPGGGERRQIHRDVRPTASCAIDRHLEPTTAAVALQMNAQHAITGRHIDSRLDERVFAERVVFGDESAVLDEQRESTRGVNGRDEPA